MPSWVLLPLLLAALIGAAFLWRATARRALPPGALRGYNVLLVTIDTLRADRLGSYGSSSGLTPHLDRIAKEGVRFARASAHVPLTLPSHTSILSGTTPARHRVHDNGTFRVHGSLPTLGTLLGDAGYRTGAFVGAFVLDARFGLDRGFDDYDDYYGEKRSFVSFAENERRAETVAAAAEKWILGSPEEPWFAWVHVFDPHTPYDAPAPFQKAHPGDPYGAEVAYVDHVIGGLWKKLDSEGALERTLVVVTGDHGESLGDHGERTHGTFAYDATLRVPWLLWAKPIEPRVVEELVSHVDLAPTALELLGIDPPEGIEGRSLVAAFEGEAPEPRAVYFEALNAHLTRDWAPLRGIIANGFKYIDLPIPELYALEDDPGETKNLARERPALVREMRRELLDRAGAIEAVTREGPDAETARRLRSLGYTVAPASTRKADYTEADDPKRLIQIANAYDDAADLFTAGRTEEAVALLRDLRERQPRSSYAHQKLAYALRQTGRVDEAVAILEEAVENGIDEMSLLGLLGAYLLDTGDASRARVLLEDLVRRHPGYVEAHNYLGVALARLGRSEEARRELERVIDVDPSSAMAYNNLGSLALGDGDVETAVELFQTALRYDPGLASAHNGLGVAHARRGDMSAAIESWRRAVENDPAQFDALFNLAIALAESSPEQAVPYLERFIATAPPARYGADIARLRAERERIRARSASPQGR